VGKSCVLENNVTNDDDDYRRRLVRGGGGGGPAAAADSGVAQFVFINVKSDNERFFYMCIASAIVRCRVYNNNNNNNNSRVPPARIIFIRSSSSSAVPVSFTHSHTHIIIYNVFIIAPWQ